MKWINLTIPKCVAVSSIGFMSYILQNICMWLLLFFGWFDLIDHCFLWSPHPLWRCFEEIFGYFFSYQHELYYKCWKTMDIVHIKYVHKVVYLSTISTETKIFDIYSERMICFKTEVSSSLWIKLNKTKNLIDTRNWNGESLWIHYLLGCW